MVVISKLATLPLKAGLFITSGGICDTRLPPLIDPALTGTQLRVCMLNHDSSSSVYEIVPSRRAPCEPILRVSCATVTVLSSEAGSSVSVP